MIDISTEELIDLRTACKEPVFRSLRTGKPLHLSGAYRYVLRGARAADGTRVCLETIVTPRGRRTTREAIARFISALTNPGSALPPPNPAVRKEQIDRAEKELAAAGFELGHSSPAAPRRIAVRRQRTSH